MATTSGHRAPFETVRDALRILEALAARPGGLPAHELATRTGLAPGTLPGLLRWLTGEGYVRRLPDGGYAPGAPLLLLGSGAQRRRLRREKLQQALDALRDSLGAAVYFARYADGELEVTATSQAPQAPSVHEWVDFRAAAHATAIGKCLLSQLDHDGRRDHLSRHRAARLTSRTITDAHALLGALERQPATMPVLDLQEYAVGTLCAAVPVTAGSTAACLALSLPLGEGHRLRSAAESLNRQAAPTLLSLAL
ncbi:IclR family transcriptional regulator C-terminal domain-containing protein [Streptomyces sp. DSM 44917]|uniref:IclR family transcriptional regulator C-terminal domain-containing protein n=1 Tax=Streptomyces boetiae TaxID=3075541 RepID=A0ABU2L8B5_9ACTN|nr:IclR family transcriptional regulator C-terminal domain-containing protein [Streptomyces sp. DSM 44917]MDT0307809.1 IclR family transcriptional regulator C-terminal domain-containing protein [Streptomyces sp. DSM 44917]